MTDLPRASGSARTNCRLAGWHSGTRRRPASALQAQALLSGHASSARPAPVQGAGPQVGQRYHSQPSRRLPRPRQIRWCDERFGYQDHEGATATHQGRPSPTGPSQPREWDNRKPRCGCICPCGPSSPSDFWVRARRRLWSCLLSLRRGRKVYERFLPTAVLVPGLLGPQGRSLKFTGFFGLVTGTGCRDRRLVTGTGPPLRPQPLSVVDRCDATEMSLTMSIPTEGARRDAKGTFKRRPVVVQCVELACPWPRSRLEQSDEPV